MLTARRQAFEHQFVLQREPNPSDADRLLIVNASSLLTGTPDPSAGDLSPVDEDRGDVKRLYEYFKEFLVIGANLAGCRLPAAVNEPDDLLELRDLVRGKPTRKILVVLDEIDRHGISFTTVAHFFSMLAKDDPVLVKKYIVFVPASLSIRTNNNAATTFTLGAAYEYLTDCAFRPCVEISSRATQCGADGIYLHKEKIVLDCASLESPVTLPKIHVVQLGGTIGGFNGVLDVRPPDKTPMNEQRVGQFFQGSNNNFPESHFEVETEGLFFDDSREIETGDIGKIRGRICAIAERDPVIVTCGTFMAAPLSRMLGAQKNPVAFVGALGLLGHAMTDGGFNLGAAVQYLRSRPKAVSYDPVVVMGGSVIPSEFAMKIGEKNTLIDSRIAGKLGELKIVHDPWRRSKPKPRR